MSETKETSVQLLFISYPIANTTKLSQNRQYSINLEQNAIPMYPKNEKVSSLIYTIAR